MKHLFQMPKPDPVAATIPENTEVMLLPAYEDPDAPTMSVRVFVPIGYLSNSDAMAHNINHFMLGRVWGTLTRNDGHYIEVETEDHEGASDVPSSKTP